MRTGSIVVIIAQLLNRHLQVCIIEFFLFLTLNYVTAY